MSHRRSPVRHTVRAHKRQGKSIGSFERGKGQKPQRSRRRRVLANNTSGKINTLADEIERARRKDVPLKFGYHATHSLEVAKGILKEGFKDRTYFATNMENAYAGGARPYVFEVLFCMDFEPRNGWQWVETGITSSDRIHALYPFDTDPLYKDSKVFDMMSDHNMDLMRRKGKEAVLI